MKSVPASLKAGNIKCKGKKTKLLSCRCCVMFNAKVEFREKEMKQELTQFIRTCE